MAYKSPGKTSEQLRAEMAKPGYVEPRAPGLNVPGIPGYVFNEQGQAVPGYAVDFKAPAGIEVPPQVDAQGEDATDAPYAPPEDDDGAGAGAPAITPLMAGLGIAAVLLFALPGRRR